MVVFSTIAIGLQCRSQCFRESAPSRPDRPPHSDPPADVERQSKAAPKHWHQWDAERSAERSDPALPGVDEAAAGLRVNQRRVVADGPDTSADPRSGVDDLDPCAAPREIVGGGEAAQTRAHDNYAHSVHRHRGLLLAPISHFVMRC